MMEFLSIFMMAAIVQNPAARFASGRRLSRFLHDWPATAMAADNEKLKHRRAFFCETAGHRPMPLSTAGVIP
jgi:hypothetical protein